jgi:hypothetical protein
MQTVLFVAMHVRVLEFSRAIVSQFFLFASFVSADQILGKPFSQVEDVNGFTCVRCKPST